MITRDGTRSVAVENVHTHELWIGPDGNVHGDDVQNVGDAYRHRVWKRTASGTTVNTQPWRSGHPTDYYDFSFNYDDDGQMYVLRRDNTSIDVRSRGGDVVRTVQLDETLGFPHWMTVATDGTAFVTVGSTLLRIAAGQSETRLVATNLVQRTPAFADLHDRHALMGIWTDAAGNVFVADYAGQAVRQVSVDGHVTTVWRGEGKWSAAGGTVDVDGSLLILEWSASNAVRVSRVLADGTTTVLANDQR